MLMLTFGYSMPDSWIVVSFDFQCRGLEGLADVLLEHSVGASLVPLLHSTPNII